MKFNFFKEYFSFSTRERNGIIVLCVILLIIISTKIIIHNNKNKAKTDYSSFEKEIDNFNDETTKIIEYFYFDPNIANKEDFEKLGFSQKAIKSILNFREKNGKFHKKEDLKKIYNVSEEEYSSVENYIVIQNNYSKNNYKKYNKKEKKETTFFNFDPNTASTEDFENLGLKKWQALNIIKYRENGGNFKSKEDFSKIYGIDKKDYEKLKDYIVIDTSLLNNKKTTSKKDKSIIIELNSATSEELQKLQGIGISFANRIIEYKNKLGGYYKKEQLLEIYGFNEELYSLIEKQIIIDTNKIEKININTANFSKLIKHPYFDKENVKTILNFKKFAGEIKNYEELVKQKAISKEFFTKTNPYIKTE